MPFDGCEFSRASGPRPLTPTPTGPRRTATAWLRVLFRRDAGGEEPRLPVPGHPGHTFEPPAVHLLREARALIGTEEAWVQMTYRTPHGRHCAVGALRAAARGTGRFGLDARREAHAFLLAVAKEHGFGDVELMNDGSTHAEVLAAFDAAIRRAERR